MLIGAHRGYSARAPENTLASFELAINSGAKLIELDVHLSRDQVPVVIHDEWVDRTSNGHGRVNDLTLAELKKLDFGSLWGQDFSGTRIPTLSEVMEMVKGRVMLNIEIKNGPVYHMGIEDAVVNEIINYNIKDQVIVSSFDHRAVCQVSQLLPEVKIGLLISHHPLAVQQLVPQIPIYSLHPYYAFVTEQLTSECRSAGLKVYTWGTNDRIEWKRLRDQGVDCIITDYVEEIIEQLRLGGE